MDPLQWMGAVRMRVQTADKTSQSSTSNPHHSSTSVKKKREISKTALNKHVAGFWCERQQEMDFFTGGSAIMDYELAFYLKMSWWICFLWTRSFCDVFISCLDSHSDGTHPLQRIHWWASDVMLHFSKSDAWPEGEYIHLWVNYSLDYITK